MTSCALGCPGFEFQKRQVTFLSPAHSTPTLRPNQYPNRYRSSIPVVKQPQFEFGHSSTSRTEVKHEWIYTSSPPVGLHGMKRSNVTLAFISMQEISSKRKRKREKHSSILSVLHTLMPRWSDDRGRSSSEDQFHYFSK